MIILTGDFFVLFRDYQSHALTLNIDPCPPDKVLKIDLKQFLLKLAADHL